MTIKRNKNFRQPESKLVEAFMEIFEPVIALQNSSPIRVETDATDTGQEQPALRDKTFAFLLANMAQRAHNQLYGQIIASDGRRFDNAKTWLENSRKRRDKLELELTDPDLPREANLELYLTNSDWMMAQHYVDTNEAKCQALEEIIHSCAVAYKALTKEDWKPMAQTQPDKAPRKVEITPELQAEYRRKLEARMKREANA